MSTALKVACAAALLGVWGALVFTGLAPVADFITALRDALIALGVFHATLTPPSR